MTFLRFLQDKKGATAIEYGLIAALISIAIVAAVGGFADALEAMWNGNDSEILKALALH